MESQILTNAEDTDPIYQESDTASVSGMNVIVDGSEDKEATQLDPVFGAGSDAPMSSGIPSAMRQIKIVDAHSESDPQ